MDREFIKQNATASGRCREDFSWYFLEGELYIEGSGALDYVQDWSGFYDRPISEHWKRNKPVIHPWKEWIPQIRSIEIDRGCRELGLGCFENHAALESVVIPETVRKIGVCAFQGCISLREAVIPESVEEVEDYAFCGCIAMESVALPQNIRRIGLRAFGDCRSLPEKIEEKNV